MQIHIIFEKLESSYRIINPEHKSCFRNLSVVEKLKKFYEETNPGVKYCIRSFSIDD